MRFAITALGSAGGRTVGQVVDDIVRYLEPRTPGKPAASPSVPSGDGPSSYYADRGSEPGRWLGHGAREAALLGTVAPQDFARVLAGRDPHTGYRLITAQGSAGRRPTLGAGLETRRAAGGACLYGLPDVAASLGITRQEAEALVAAGERVAVAAFSGAGTAEPAASYLVPLVDAEGTAWITDRELARIELARERGPVPAEVASTGDPDDLLTVAEAARLSGLTARYMRGLCRRWEDHHIEIEAALAEGRTPSRAYVVAWRGIKSKWLVKRGDLVAFLERRAAPAVRVGYDLTLTTEKSLGVLALLGHDETRAAVLGAIQAGNDTGIGYLELHAASARRKGEQVLARGLTVASFRHLTSRALDPFPHHHNVIANTVVDEHGSRRALDARGLYRDAQVASALATAEMRHQLTMSLGVSWRPSRSGGWEIDGIPESVVREFSRRRNEIDDAVAELEEAIGRTKAVDELQSIVLATRPAKEDVDPRELVAGWWDRAARHGLTPDGLAACSGRVMPHPTAVDHQELFDRLAAPDEGVCSGASVFTRSDVLAALVDLPVATDRGQQPLILPAAEMERLADEFLASAHVVALESPERHRRDRVPARDLFTTREILEVQQRVLDKFERGRGTGAALASDALVACAVEETGRPSAEQANLVRAFCTSGDAVQCAIGRAGAGKTTSMRAAAAAWREAGFRVVGTAVKGEATRHLAEGAGIPAETVAWFLARRDGPVLPIDDKTVLIVDEASTLSDRDLDALIDLAERAGSAIRLIGDPYQHGAVAAGGMFRFLCELHPETPDLATSHRVTDASDRRAAVALREGRPNEALAILEAASHLHVAESEIDLYIGMLQRWWQSHTDGDDHPMVARRHHTRRQLNRLARHLLRTHGALGEDEIVASGDRCFAAGDRVVARMAARHLHVPGDPTRYLRNGAHGTVVDVCEGGGTGDVLRIDFTGIGVIDVPRPFFDEHSGPGGRSDVGIDHAYAVTSYAVQGATYEASTSRIDEGATRAETYVDITRGRRSNHLFITRAPHPLDGEHLPEVPPPALTNRVSERLRRSGPERAAIEYAVATARRPAPRTVPPAEWTARFPEPAGGPVHLQRRWSAALDAVAAYRSRWHPPPGRSDWEWAVGSPVLDPAAHTEREAAMDALHAYAFAVVCESFDTGTGVFPAVAERLLGAMRRGADRATVEQLTAICQRFAERHASGNGSTPETGDIEMALAREVTPLTPQRPSLARPGIERT